MGLRIDIGSGYKNEENLIRLDRDARVNPDHIIDLEKDRLPFEDNSVEFVKAHHILEHMGDPGFFHLMVELYRVCQNGAKVDIHVPYFRHQAFYNDPTHKRAITGYVLGLFGKEFCDWTIKEFNSSSGMAYDYNVDFKTIHQNVIPDGRFTDEIMRRQSLCVSKKDWSDLSDWMHTTNDVLYALTFVLEVVK